MHLMDTMLAPCLYIMHYISLPWFKSFLFMK